MMDTRQGYWMATQSGRRVYPSDPLPDDFCIQDIAHGLSNVCRWGGQGISFFSVSEHSLRGAKRARETGDSELAFEFLLHDGAEAFFGDVVNPVALSLPAYQSMRDRAQGVINATFRLPFDMTPACKELDGRMGRTEAPVMFDHGDTWWKRLPFEPFPDEFTGRRDVERVGVATSNTAIGGARAFERTFMPPLQARRLFLAEFVLLASETGRRDVIPDSLIVNKPSRK
jgi:hypothetical protein